VAKHFREIDLVSGTPDVYAEIEFCEAWEACAGGDEVGDGQIPFAEQLCPMDAECVEGGREGGDDLLDR
jgi:hypothetical protein